MTREQIDAMETGHELDALVERLIFQREPIKWEGKYLTAHGYDGQEVARYSTEIPAVWEVVEKMKSNDWIFNINSIDDEWTALFHLDPAHEHEVTCKSAPEAISKCALLAVMNL